MRKIVALLALGITLAGFITPTSYANYYYGNNNYTYLYPYTPQNTYVAPTRVTPTYNTINNRRRAINNSVYQPTQPQVIYVYQNIPTTPVQIYGSYPGCSRADIVIGGQVWAGCNVYDRNIGSESKSGWFFANDLYSSFVSYNGQNQRLEWQGKVIPQSSWGDGPCAAGYRLPTRGEWETARYYARQNNVSLATLLALPVNGAYRGYKDSNSDVRVEARYDVTAAYWSSTVEYNGGYFPVVMHLGSTYAGYRTDGTDYSQRYNGYNWQYTDVGLELVTGTSSELANVRCIKK